MRLIGGPVTFTFAPGAVVFARPVRQSVGTWKPAIAYGILILFENGSTQIMWYGEDKEARDDAFNRAFGEG